MNRQTLPRTLTWNADHLCVRNLRRRRKKLRQLGRLLRHCDVAILTEPAVTPTEAPFIESWARARGWGAAISYSERRRFGLVILWSLSWLGARVAVPIQLLARFALRVEFWQPGAAPGESLAGTSAPELLQHGSLQHVTNGIYFKQGDPRWQVLHLRRLGLRLTDRRGELAKAAIGRRCLETLGGDWNFPLDRSDRWILAQGGRPGHRVYRVGAAASPGARFREIFLNQGLHFSEVPNDFFTLRGKSGTYLGNNDRFYVSWCGLAQQVSRW
jgi:hypothetical protein